MLKFPVRAAALAWLAVCGASFAQDGGEPQLTAEQQQTVAKMKALWQSLDRRTGKIALGSDLATLDVPQDFYYLGPADAERVLVDAWGNPPGQHTLGMLFPAEHTPFDKGSWAVTIEYDEDGHVSDSDAANTNYSDLLVEMRKDIRDSNPGRVRAGYMPIELVGWAEPPHYDSSARKLYWAKELRFGDEPDTTLNYEIRALGREGVLSMTFIASTAELAAINERRDAVLAMAQFNTGKRYEDFNSSIDKVAAYGIGALIAGKVAAKVGLLAGGLLLLKKFGVVIVVAAAAAARKIKGSFSRAA
ncbi:MAG TPA: DUF2167 domain-containing protein [Gammaproteobacteria bacterium]|jgi:uncharacterized membrane-anchored protein|nr:DUF2167 domain-containing protein [Gammaproteobacteria bacterium]